MQRGSVILVVVSLVVACSHQQAARAQGHTDAAQLTARPGVPTDSTTSGLSRLGSGQRGPSLYVPRGYSPAHPAPLLVLLHGATQSADLWTTSTSLLHLADSLGIVLLIPNSRDMTWDLMRGGFGPDVRAIDAALAQLFQRCSIDHRHIAIGGFSDGATYALSLGVSNGDLFSTIIAFSPGYFAPGERRGKPTIFIAHGTRDQILPIDVASRQIVPQLKSEGYEVTYHEFDGPHTIKGDQVESAFTWFLAH